MTPPSVSGGALLPKPPDYLPDAWESCWYVPGHDPDEAWVIDDPADLEIEKVYMRHVPPPPPGERGDIEDIAVARDKRGRFKQTWWWEVCSEKHPDAQPFLEVRYP